MSNTKNTNGNNIGFYKVLCGILATATFSLILFNGYLTTNTSQLTGSAMDDRLDLIMQMAEDRKIRRETREIEKENDCLIAFLQCKKEWDHGCQEEKHYCGEYWKGEL